MSEEPEKLAEATLISHLLELRDRLIRAMVSVGLVLMPCVFYSNDIFSFIARPLIEKLPKGTTLIATGVMSPFTTPFKLSFFVALIIAALLTPPDAISQCTMAIPMYLLYEGGLFMARILSRMKRQGSESSQAEA